MVHIFSFTDQENAAFCEGLTPHPDRELRLSSPLTHDLASSQLQKALRRGLRRPAYIAAHALICENPDYFWRRLVGIAFEDFGTSSLRVTQNIVRAARAKSWRSDMGETTIALFFLDQLLGLPSDRRVDDLYMLAVALREFPAFGSLRINDPCIKTFVDTATACVGDCERLVPKRGFRAILPRNMDARIDSYAQVPTEIKNLLKDGRKASGCILPLILGLFLQNMHSDDAGLQSEPLISIQDADVLLPAIDGYTNLGREVLTTFVREPRWQAILGRSEGVSRRKCFAMLLFAAEGGQLKAWLTDPIADRLRTLALGCWSGLSPDKIPDAIEAMRRCLPEINDRRRDFLRRNPISNQEK